MSHVLYGWKTRIFVLSLASLSMALLCFYHDRSFLGAEGKRPRMVASGTEFDFGRVSQWDILEHTFVLRNYGQGDLRIENVSPD
jgi:hypothetical protein